MTLLDIKIVGGFKVPPPDVKYNPRVAVLGRLLVQV
jgi:hypothetical protein